MLPLPIAGLIDGEWVSGSHPTGKAFGV